MTEQNGATVEEELIIWSFPQRSCSSQFDCEITIKLWSVEVGNVSQKIVNKAKKDAQSWYLLHF